MACLALERFFLKAYSLFSPEPPENNPIAQTMLQSIFNTMSSDPANDLPPLTYIYGRLCKDPEDKQRVFVTTISPIFQGGQMAVFPIYKNPHNPYILLIPRKNSSSKTFSLDRTVELFKQAYRLKVSPKLYAFYPGTNEIQLSNGILVRFSNCGDLVRVVNDRLLRSVKEKVDISIQICKQIFALHQNHIYHGDIKPDNIVLETKKRSYVVKIIDFGAASKFFHVDNKPGSPDLMPPEYYVSELTPKNTYNAKRRDVYVLGLTLYSLFTGYFLHKKYPLDLEKYSKIEKIQREEQIKQIHDNTIQNALCQDILDQNVAKILREFLQFYPKKRILLEKAISDFERIRIL